MDTSIACGSSGSCGTRAARLTRSTIASMSSRPTMGQPASTRRSRPPRSPVHGQAARHADRLAGDERRIVAGEEADRAGNILRLADALHRNGADQGGAHLLAALVVAR